MKNNFILSLVKWLLGFLNMDKNPNVSAMVGDIIAANLSKKAIMIPIGHKNSLLMALSLYVKEQLKGWASAKTYSTQELYENRILEIVEIVKHLQDTPLEVNISMKVATTEVTIFSADGDNNFVTTLSDYWDGEWCGNPAPVDLKFQIGK